MRIILAIKEEPLDIIYCIHRRGSCVTIGKRLLRERKDEIMRRIELPGYVCGAKWIWMSAVFLICVMLFGGHASAEEEIQSTGAKKDGPVWYIALGDSIPNGYYGTGESEVTSYPILIAGDLHSVSGREIWISRFTKNGLTAKKLNSTMLLEPDVQQMLSQAELITLTIGSNDLMNEFKKVSREILNNQTRFYTADEALAALQDGIEENPLLLMNIASAIGSWDYSSFEDQWVLAMDTIALCRREDAQIAVTTIYNPMKGRELPGTLNAVVESVISGMNEIIWKYAEEYGYHVVDLFDSGIEDLTQSDGLHPNQEGQDMIRMLMENELDLSLFQNPESDEEVLRMQKELEEAAQKKAREAEQKRQQQRGKRVLIGVGIGAAVCLVLAGILLLVRRNRRKKAVTGEPEAQEKSELS